MATSPLTRSKQPHASAVRTDSDTNLLQTMKNNFQGKIVGVQGSTNAELFVREFLGGFVDIRTYDTQDNLDLSTGRIDWSCGLFSVARFSK